MILFTEETGAAYQETFAAAAKELKGDVLFVTSGATDGIQARLADFIGVTAEDTPCIRLLDPRGEGMLKYQSGRETERRYFGRVESGYGSSGRYLSG